MPSRKTVSGYISMKKWNSRKNFNSSRFGLSEDDKSCLGRKSVIKKYFINNQFYREFYQILSRIQKDCWKPLFRDVSITIKRRVAFLTLECENSKINVSMVSSCNKDNSNNINNNNDTGWWAPCLHDANLAGADESGDKKYRDRSYHVREWRRRMNGHVHARARWKSRKRVCTGV